MITPPQPPSPSDVAAHYDDLDDFYRDTWGHHLNHGYWKRGDETSEEAVSLLTHTVAALLNLDQPNARVLDIGCGYGETASFLAENHHAQVTGYTLSKVQHDQAASRPPSSPNTPIPDFILADFLENDLPGDTFDAALSIECVSHIADKQTFFEEIHHLLKPGARLVLCAWLAKEDASPLQRRYLLEPICRDGRLAGLATMAEYRDLIAYAGLHLLEANDIGPRVAKTWTVIFRRVLKKIFTDPRYLRFLLKTLTTRPTFLLTVPRLLCAYRFRCIGYLLLVAEKTNPEP